jgi:GR25 family glycosyltransferase involved in LPS biosynthesis
MFDACFIVETIQEKKKTKDLSIIASKLGIKQILPFQITNVTKEQLVGTGDAVPQFANMNSNDLNNFIKFEQEKRMLTLKEIKHYVEHKTAWKMMLDKKMNNVLVLDNSIQLKKEFENNFVEKITEIVKNAPPLYSVISLVDSSKTRKVIRKCNEFFNYPDVPEMTHMGYIISKPGLKKILNGIPLSPIRGPICNFINELRLFEKDIYVMKYPIFDIETSSVNSSEDSVCIKPPQQLSLPVKQVQYLFKKIYIIKKDALNNNFFILVSLLTQRLGISTYIKSNEEEVWKKVAKEKDDVLVINNNVRIDFKQLSMHLGLIANELPVNFNLIALSSKENTIKHPFRFSANLDFVHPDMHEFSGYLLSKKGALMLLKNKEHKNRNLMLSREHYCFAYKNKMLEIQS